MTPAGKHIDTDILVIGSGVAGLAFALKAAGLGRVLVIAKSSMRKGSTELAQGGIASVQSPDDSIELHIQDTLRVGYGLAHEDVVRKVTGYSQTIVEELLSLGVSFDSESGFGKKLDLGLEGGHSRKRILHVADATGQAIEDAYVRAAKKNPNIELLPRHCAIDLLTQHHLPEEHPLQKEPVRCWGAYILDEEGGFVRTVRAKITLLATGGGGRLYLHTTNPDVSTADGVAMAYRAGATVANLEFFQFHPTMFYDPGGEGFLISEAVRGEGAILRNRAGERFMEGIHPQMELAPRDVVARAIDEQLKRTGDTNVFLDLTHKGTDFIKERFPTIYEHCIERGLDITKDWIPVVPAAHYMCGGVKVDAGGRTEIANLLAAGETACTGMHGANRLASNSLLESIAFAHFAYDSAREVFPKAGPIPELPDWDDFGVFNRQEWVIVRHLREELNRLMWDYVGIVRSDDRLEAARRFIHYISQEVDKFYRANPVRRDVIEVRNLTLLATIVIRSAMTRLESRGLHYNSDHPEQDERFQCNTEFRSSLIAKDVHLEEAIIGTA